jgi:hypothetical protein
MWAPGQNKFDTPAVGDDNSAEGEVSQDKEDDDDTLESTGGPIYEFLF